MALLSCFAVAALALPSSPETALGHVIGEWMFPLSAFSALLALVAELLVFLPLSLYEFCRLGAYMRRRASFYPEPTPDFHNRGDPSIHGGPRGDILLDDDPE